MLDPQVPIEDVAGAVKKYYGRGKVKHWGLSEIGLKTPCAARMPIYITAVQNGCSML